MSIDSMRVGGGRCPPLLVGGLIIACIMMVCNWWTLSSTNLELLRQIDELNEQIKISVEERDQCVTQRGIFEKQLKNCQDDGRTTHVKLSQVDDTLSTCNEELNSYKNTEITRTATIEALRLDKKELSAQLDTKREENKKLEEELSKTKDELAKVKLSLNAPLPKQTPLLPARLMEKLQSDNKTTANAPPPPPNQQVNAPPNVEQQKQDAQERDNSNMKEDNAAEVNDGVNALDPDLNFNLMSDPKGHETKK